MVVTTLPFLMLIPVDNGGHPTAAVDNDLKPLALSVITTLPFPMLIPVDDNDLKSLALSGKRGNPTEGGVTGRTVAASRSPSTTRPQRKPKLDNGHLYQCVLSHVNEERS